MPSASRADASLPELLMQRARRASDMRLALDTGVGALVAIGVAVWRGPGWVLFVCAALCFAAFGAWGITDRELRDPSFPANAAVSGALRCIRALAVAVGVIAALTLLFGLTAVGLGTWIS